MHHLFGYKVSMRYHMHLWVYVNKYRINIFSVIVNLAFTPSIEVFDENWQWQAQNRLLCSTMSMMSGLLGGNTDDHFSATT
jgi:hypothetical protein